MLAISLVSMTAMLLVVLMVNEDLENTMLQAELQEQREIFLALKPDNAPLVWETTNLSVAHLPKNAPLPANMPAIFANLPINYSGELKHNGRTFLVRIDPSISGVFYVAKDITHFEERETLFQMTLGVVIIVLTALSLLLAALSSRRLVIPLRRLSYQISNTPVGALMPRIPLDYQDSELHAIAHTFNRFLDELESFVKREQSLLNLASHELRTPIAVISGALDVLEQRQQLTANDQATVTRIRSACTEMEANVSMLLTLARRDPGQDKRQPVALSLAVQLALESLDVAHQASSRVTVSVHQPATVIADATIVGMLLRNLIQNALLHTPHAIQIRLTGDMIEIADQGTGLNDDQLAVLSGLRRIAQNSSTLTGLGLYIVTLMCERLRWRLDVVQSTNKGTIIQLHTQPAQHTLPRHAPTGKTSG